jgi:hypothetical protein
MTAGQFSKLAVATTFVALLGASASAAPAAPTPFQLVFNGYHVVADFPSPTGLSHVGPFTTDYAACPSGFGQNTAETDQGVATRLFTCDGSGATFTALVWPQLAEHGGGGSWRIISGTGALTDLRGEGTFSSVLTSGDPNDFITIHFQSTWAGSIDLDAVPPALAVTKASVVKSKSPAHAYRLSLALALTDNGGGPVKYRLAIVDPRTSIPLASRAGTTSAGSLRRSFVLKPSRKSRALRLRLDASDAVGNQATLKKMIRLRK